MIEKAEGLAVHGLERETLSERAGLEEILYYKDSSRNDEIGKGFIDLRDDLGPGSNSDVGFWLDAVDEGIGESHRGVYLLHRRKDGRSFLCGFVQTTGLNEDGEPEYGVPELSDDLPADLVEAHLLREPLEVGAPSDLFGGMKVTKVGIKSRRPIGKYKHGHWGENPIEKIIMAQQIAHATK
jgi:hypothetical protein